MGAGGVGEHDLQTPHQYKPSHRTTLGGGQWSPHDTQHLQACIWFWRPERPHDSDRAPKSQVLTLSVILVTQEGTEAYYQDHRESRSSS